jgi:hypothetical protein
MFVDKAEKECSYMQTLDFGGNAYQIQTLQQKQLQ